MSFALEIKKLKRTGFFPAFLIGALLASLFPVVNMAARQEMFVNQPLAPLEILLNANWSMMATLNVFLVIIGSCMMYYGEFANRAIEKLHMLPLNLHVLFFSKVFLLLAAFIPVLAIEEAVLLFCSKHWFSEKELQLDLLLGNAGFSLAMLLPVILLMLLIASLCKNMWISLGAGVILLFSAQTIYRSDNILAKIYTFSMPYQFLTKDCTPEKLAPLFLVWAGEILLFGAAKMILIKFRRTPV